MGVRKIKKYWYIDISFNHQRYRKKSPDNSRAGAKAYEAMARQKFTKGKDPFITEEKVEIEIENFENFSKEFMKTYVINNNKPSEIRMKQITMKAHLIPFFGKIKLDKISSRLIEEYKSKKIKTGLAKKTVNNHLAILSKCLHIANEWSSLEKIPKIKMLKLPPSEFDFLSPEDSEFLLNSIEDGQWREMILMALKTGLRLGELSALDWSDINFNNQTLTVRSSYVRDTFVSPKSNRKRHIPLTSEVFSVLSKRREKKGLIFPDIDGQPLKPERARRTLHRLCKKAELRKVGWHMLRHTFASHLACKGVSLKTIQELLGHSDLKMTLRYAHLSPSTLKEAINLLDKPIEIEFSRHYVGNENKIAEKVPVLRVNQEL